MVAILALLVGCEQRSNPVREIQQRRDRQQAAADVDHIREAFGFLSELAELDETAAKQRITSALNSRIDGAPAPTQWSPPALLQTLDPVLASYPPVQNLAAPRFVPDDVDYLQLNYLLRQVTQWAGEATAGDPLFIGWLSTMGERLGADGELKLQRASRLFDWTIRNIQLEPLTPEDAAPPAPNLPAGLVFRGPGYRQTTLQTLMRGSGDAWQRSRVFIQLCRQAGVDACMLGLRQSEAEDPQPWLVGVQVGDQLYLFEPQLGVPVPGPDQVGIATLAEAREDASVLRRLNVPGWFEYPVDSQMVQQTVAMLDAPPESMSWRMAHLQSALTGETRMVLGYDVDASGQAFDAIPGVAMARLWPVAIRAQIYQRLIAEVAKSDRQIAAWEAARWGMLTPGFPLAQARWEHLRGEFNRNGQEQGARVMYMDLRHPEFEIGDLRYNVDLQQRYGIRRELGQSAEEYDFRIQQIQAMMRTAKRAAIYWLSLIHYDTGDYKNARNWFEKRVLEGEQASRWTASGRYNLARSLEYLGELEQAAELYKTIGDPQEHGNRIRARLLTRQP